MAGRVSHLGKLQSLEINYFTDVIDENSALVKLFTLQGN